MFVMENCQTKIARVSGTLVYMKFPPVVTENQYYTSYSV